MPEFAPLRRNLAHTVHTKMWSAAISPAVLAGTSNSVFLDAMLSEMKQGDARSAEVMLLRPGGRGQDSMGYRYSFSSLPRLHCLREFPM